MTTPCEHDWSFDGETPDGTEADFSCVKCGVTSHVISRRHPSVIPETVRVVGRTPSGAPLHEWVEEYPDGSAKGFREIWHEVAGGSDLIYGGIQVIRTH